MGFYNRLYSFNLFAKWTFLCFVGRGSEAIILTSVVGAQQQRQ